MASVAVPCCPPPLRLEGEKHGRPLLAQLVLSFMAEPGAPAGLLGEASSCVGCLDRSPSWFGPGPSPNFGMHSMLVEGRWPPCKPLPAPLRSARASAPARSLKKCTCPSLYPHPWGVHAPHSSRPSVRKEAPQAMTLHMQRPRYACKAAPCARWVVLPHGPPATSLTQPT